MAGWGRMIAGVVIGAAGALYATNEELRKRLPEKARGLPVAVRKRFDEARAAGREASALRRAEILRELEVHGGTDQAPGRGLPEVPRVTPREKPQGQPPEVPPDALLDAAPPRTIAEPAERPEEV